VEIDRLYDGMRACLLEATEKVRLELGEDVYLEPQRWKQNQPVMLSAEGRFRRQNGDGDRCDQVRQLQCERQLRGDASADRRPAAKRVGWSAELGANLHKRKDSVP
jgi:hypothetical protein